MDVIIHSSEEHVSCILFIQRGGLGAGETVGHKTSNADSWSYAAYVLEGEMRCKSQLCDQLFHYNGRSPMRL